MIKKWVLLLAAMFIVVAITACGGGDNGDDGGNDSNGDAGEQTAADYDADAADSSYQQNCAACHGGNLEGATGPALEQVGNNYSEEEILDIILNGKGSGMPGGLITGDEAENVAAWLADQQ